MKKTRLITRLGSLTRVAKQAGPATWGAARGLAKRALVEGMRRAEARRRQTAHGLAADLSADPADLSADPADLSADPADLSADPYGGLGPERWGCGVDERGHLTLQGQSVVDLAQRFGTPLHVVDRARLQANVDAFLRPFRSRWPRVALGTSYKSNPLPAVLTALHEVGTRAEVVSHFELWLARRLGVPGDQIIVNGPGKTLAEIEFAVSERVGIINIDSHDEIARLAAVAARHGHRQPVGIRVVSAVGWSGQLGIPIQGGAAFAAFRSAAQHPSLRVMGIHLHLGTSLTDRQIYLDGIAEVLALVRRVQAELGVQIELVDLGGGFAVPTVRAYDAWDARLIAVGYPPREAFVPDCPTPQDYAEPVVAMLRETFPAAGAEPLLVFEPGRAITASAQLLLLRVVAQKPALRGGQRRLVVDGGKNVAMPLSWESHQIFAAGHMNRDPSAPYDIYGPLCHPDDVIRKHKRLPELSVGDTLAVMDAGAYFVPNQMNFSHPRAAVVMLHGGQTRLVRRRESFEDIVRLDTLPNRAPVEPV